MGIERFDEYMAQVRLRPADRHRPGRRDRRHPAVAGMEGETRQANRWYPGDTVNVGIGQGFWKVTPLQLARGAAAHRRRRPAARAAPGDATARRRSTRRGQPVPQPPAVPISHSPEQPAGGARRHDRHHAPGPAPRAAAIRAARLPIAGKTGTAQVVSRKGNGSGQPACAAADAAPPGAVHRLRAGREPDDRGGGGGRGRRLRRSSPRRRSRARCSMPGCWARCPSAPAPPRPRAAATQADRTHRPRASQQANAAACAGQPGTRAGFQRRAAAARDAIAAGARARSRRPHRRSTRDEHHPALAAGPAAALRAQPRLVAVPGAAGADGDRAGGAVQRRQRIGAHGDRAGRAFLRRAWARCGRLSRVPRAHPASSSRRWPTWRSLLPLLLVLAIGTGKYGQPLDRPEGFFYFQPAELAQADPADDGWPGTCDRGACRRALRGAGGAADHRAADRAGPAAAGLRHRGAGAASGAFVLFLAGLSWWWFARGRAAAVARGVRAGRRGSGCCVPTRRTAS